jgi:hypothetical protein
VNVQHATFLPVSWLCDHVIFRKLCGALSGHAMQLGARVRAGDRTGQAPDARLITMNRNKAYANSCG